MSETLVVLMEGRVAGTLTRSRSGALRLRYDVAYARAGATPLSVAMPVDVPEHRGAALEAWLAGLLPDNEAVIARWARRFRTGTSPFALLGAPVGEDCAGAVQFARPERVPDLLDRPGDVEWLTDDEVAARLRGLEADATAWLGGGAAGGSGQFSLAGAQAKTALLLEDGRWGVPSGARATSHILKPAVAGLDQHDLNEHLCMRAARHAGLVVAGTRVRRFGDRTAIVVTRYDRVPAEGGLVRVHQEDLCQALGVHPSRKYESEGGPGAADVIGLLRRVMPPAAAERAVARLVDALIWNWLITGTDGHAKNHALLLAGEQVRLAPLYDVASALPYPEVHERRMRLAMRIGRDYSAYPAHDPWPHAAERWGLPAERLRARVRELAARAPAAFAEAAVEPDVAALGSDLPARLTDLVAGRCDRCIRALDVAADASG